MTEYNPMLMFRNFFLFAQVIRKKRQRDTHQQDWCLFVSGNLLLIFHWYSPLFLVGLSSTKTWWRA